MQKQLIPADFDHIRDKPKVRHVGLFRSQEGHNYGDVVAADLLYNGRIVKAFTITFRGHIRKTTIIDNLVQPK